MNLTRFPSPVRSAFRALSVVFALTVSSLAFGAPLLGKNIVVTQGSAQSTLVDLQENPDGTLSILAEQTGKLSGLGAFTGHFAYVATIDFNTGTTFINGEGMLHLPGGDLEVSIHLIQVGLDYPRPFTGLLIVTGGTGKFAKTSGLFSITGIDVEDLTDNVRLVGTLFNVAKK